MAGHHSVSKCIAPGSFACYNTIPNAEPTPVAAQLWVVEHVLELSEPILDGSEVACADWSPSGSTDRQELRSYYGNGVTYICIMTMHRDHTQTCVRYLVA